MEQSIGKYRTNKQNVYMSFDTIDEMKRSKINRSRMSKDGVKKKARERERRSKIDSSLKAAKLRVIIQTEICANEQSFVIILIS